MAMPATVMSQAAPESEGAAVGGAPLPETAGSAPPNETAGAATRGGEAYLFLTPQEAAFVAAVVARMVSDEAGAGALGQPRGLDRLLARSLDQKEAADGMAWGGDADARTPLAVRFRAAVQAVGRYSRSRYAGRDFAALRPDEQDEVLARLEMGDLASEGLASGAFYNFLLEHSIRAYFCDPDDQGDRDAEVWRLIGFLSSFSTVTDAA